MILNKYNTLSLLQHHTLYTTLLTKYKGDIFDNYRQTQSNVTLSPRSRDLHSIAIQTKTKPYSTCIANISDDCLSHICTFLDPQSRFIMQQSCRLFTVISRRESSFTTGYTFQYKGFFKITPNKQLLIDKLLSDDNSMNLMAIQEIAHFTQLSNINLPIFTPYYRDIQSYSHDMPNIIRTIITKNVLNDPSCLDLLIYELHPQNHGGNGNLLLSTAAKVLANNNGEHILRLLKALTEYIKTSGNILNFMQCDQLVRALMNTLINHKSIPIEEKTDSLNSVNVYQIKFGVPTPYKQIVSYGCDIFRFILLSGIGYIHICNLLIVNTHRQGQTQKTCIMFI